MLEFLPSFEHPWAALIGLLIGLPAGSFLSLCTERFAYDDEDFDPAKGPRPERVFLSDLEDTSGLPWQERIPFFGYLIGMVACCRFELLREPPHCNDCHRFLPWRERIPLVSYLTLGGRCSRCRGRIPHDHLWLEILTPLTFYLAMGYHGATIEGVLLCVLAMACLSASFVDWKYQIIPDEVPTAALAIGTGSALAHTVHALLTAPPRVPDLRALLETPAFMDPWHLGWAAGGAAAGGLVLWALQRIGTLLAGTEAMGGGDVKLAVGLGTFVGPKGAMVSLFYAAILGALCGGVLKLVGGGKREGGFTKFAFGPYICLGILAVALLGADQAFAVYWGVNEDVVEFLLWLRGDAGGY